MEYVVKKNYILEIPQRHDHCISTVLRCKEKGEKPSRTTYNQESRGIKILLREWDKLYVSKDGTLHRKTNEYDQLVMPEKYKPLVYRELHDEMGHLGSERVFQLATQRFYWPNMRDDIEKYCSKRCLCRKQRKPTTTSRAPLMPIITTYAVLGLYHPLTLASAAVRLQSHSLDG